MSLSVAYMPAHDNTYLVWRRLGQNSCFLRGRSCLEIHERIQNEPGKRRQLLFISTEMMGDVAGAGSGDPRTNSSTSAVIVVFGRAGEAAKRPRMAILLLPARRHVVAQQDTHSLDPWTVLWTVPWTVRCCW